MRKLDLDIWTQPRDSLTVVTVQDSVCLESTKSKMDSLPIQSRIVKKFAVKQDLPSRNHRRRCPVKIPELSAVHGQSLDLSCPVITTKESLDVQNHPCKDFTAGPKADQGLTAGGNQIPVVNNKRNKFASNRGQDFKYVVLTIDLLAVNNDPTVFNAHCHMGWLVVICCTEWTGPALTATRHFSMYSPCL